MVEIPVSLLSDMQQVPRDCPVALLMRHSARFPIINPSDPYAAMLTEEGVRMAEDLGAILGQRYSCGRLMSSPVSRCIDTAAAIARGAGWQIEVQSDERLSHPFIEPAWEQLSRGEINGTLPIQVSTALDLLIDPAGTIPALDIMVTHDTHVGAVAGCLFKAPVTGEHWPAFLEGMFVWRKGGQVTARWRGVEMCFGPDYHPV